MLKIAKDVFTMVQNSAIRALKVQWEKDCNYLQCGLSLDSWLVDESSHIQIQFPCIPTYYYCILHLLLSISTLLKYATNMRQEYYLAEAWKTNFTQTKDGLFHLFQFLVKNLVLTGTYMYICQLLFLRNSLFLKK